MDIGATLKDYGLAGVIIFVLATVVVYLFRENRELIKQLFGVQEQRRVEALETAKEMQETLSTFSRVNQLLIEKIEAVKGGRQ